jgi:hypothetical protein
MAPPADPNAPPRRRRRKRAICCLVCVREREPLMQPTQLMLRRAGQTAPRAAAMRRPVMQRQVGRPRPCTCSETAPLERPIGRGAPGQPGVAQAAAAATPALSAAASVPYETCAHAQASPVMSSATLPRESSCSALAWRRAGSGIALARSSDQKCRHVVSFRSCSASRGGGVVC